MIKKLLVWCLAMTLLGACGSIMPVKRINIAGSNSLSEPSLEKIADGVWIHKSYEYIAPWGPMLSQGLVVETQTGVFLVDTAWNNKDTEKLLALIEGETGELPNAAVVTHAHQDKMGGVSALISHGIETYAHPFTNEDAPGRGLQRVNDIWIDAGIRWKEILIEQADDGFSRVTVILDRFYPGPGHTRDNIVVYYEPAKVLFGGCLIRPGASDNLGNTADADIANWAEAVRRVAAEFPEAEIIIPSHGPMGGRELFDHTIALAEAAVGLDNP